MRVTFQCGSCGTRFEGDAPLPVDGDLIVCLGCGAFLLYGVGTLREVSAEHVAAHTTADDYAKILQIREDIRRKKN